ncbi:MAG TPA: amino acid adenylation domain-containing protein, partial [Rudaea sp.]|nr:amino acid adenylation domain-containing protein [Rudaea sp.]
MNSVAGIIGEALAHDVVLYLKDGRLAYSAATGAFPDALKATIAENKDAIIDYLRALEREREVLEFRPPPIAPRSASAELPLSFSQRRLWFVDKFDGGSVQFNMVNVFQAEGCLDAEAFERALHALIERHESLRTVFAEGDGEPRQIVQERFAVPLTRIDLRHLPREVQETEIAAIVARDANTSFDLARDVLLRTTLIARSDTENVIVFDVHHIACDGWSLSLLVEEFSRMYAAYTQGEPNPLAPLPIQYADYAVWQRQWLTGDVLEKQLEYWNKRLDAIPHVHALPLDRPRPAQQTWRGRFHVQTIDAELTRELSELARRHDATMFILLQSVFALLVGRYGNEADVVMGTPIAGRAHKDTEALIGFFVNSLVLRSDLSGNPTFADFLRRNRDAILEDYTHQQVPFEMLVERMRPERNTSHSPLFQIVFGLNNNENRQLELPGLKLYSLPNGVSTAKVDLELSITQVDGILNVLWSFNSDLFDAGTIVAMAQSFERLLRGAAADASRRILSLPLLDEPRERAVLALGAGKKRELPDDCFVHREFEQRALAHPDALAAACGGARLSYAQLNARANRLAHYLEEIDLRRGARVGVYVERSIEMLIAVLGIMKAGATYVPLEPSHPRARIDYIVKDAAIELVVVSGALVDRLPLGGFDVLPMDGAVESAEWLDGYSESDPAHDVEMRAEDALAYVLYTSGSTGSPKGVMVQHRGVYNYLAHAAEAYLDDALAGAVVSSPLCFDATLTTLLAPFFAGKPVLLLPDDEHALDALHAMLFGVRDWLFKITPAHLDALAQMPGPLTSPREHVIVVGGEQLTTATLLHWKNALPRATFVNEYGPTETVVGCSTFTVSGSTPNAEIAGRAAVPIGKAIANTELFVLNEALVPQPVNSVGELYIAGAGVARGYVNLPAETASRFVANPFGEAAAGRLYKTGDLVRWLPDGNLEFLGRVDEQVKVRGYRIELGEIEGQLRLIDGVREAAVVLGGRGGELVAYVVADDAMPGARYRERLAQALPDYMVPAAVVVLEEMPLTPNGKVDRKKLPAADLASAPQEDYVAPRNAVEERCCAIWQELLEVARVGIHDNFFDLGGHSLLALRLLGRVREEFDTELPLRALFANPTVAAFAVLLGSAAKPALPPIEKAAAGDAPLSFAQQRLWFIDRLQGGSIQYNMPGVFKLEGALDETAFVCALREIFRRHEVLRTEFFETDDGVRQRVRDEFELPLAILDLSHLPAQELDGEIRRRCLSDLETPFDLTRDLPLRVTLLRRCATEHVLVFNMHHIASDGWSMAILVKEFCASYAAHVEGREPALPPLPVQYADYARWQARHVTKRVLERGIDYWRERLAGAPAVHALPLDRPRPAKATYRGAAHAQRLPAELARRIAAFCRTADVTLSMFLQTAFAVLLGRWSNETDVVIGTTVAGRTQRETEALIGFFVNSLVFRADLSGNPRFADLLGAAKRQILADFDHQHVPFEALVEALNPERSLSYSPLFQVAFSLHNNERAQMTLPGLAFSAMAQETTTCHFELVLNVLETDDALHLGWVYNRDLFDAAKIANLAESFGVLLTTLLSNPDVAIQEASIVDAAVQSAGLRGAALALGADATFCALFDRAAQRHAAADAVISGERRLSYDALREKSDRLARCLADLGIGPGSRVGIYMERCAEMLVAMLGVAKAGAAYVPLEPGHPQPRIRYIVDDADVELLLVSAATANRTIEGVDVFAMDDAVADDGWLAEFADGAALPHAAADDLAYVLYTSGSTGNPKGVMITHGGLVNYLRYAGEAYLEAQIAAGIVSSPLCFDATITSLLAPLCHGRSIVLLPDDDGVLTALADHLAQDRTAYLFKITPAHLEALAHDVAATPASLQKHVLVIGGEQLTGATLAAWRRRLPAATFVNEYGPTETVVGCSTYFVRPGDAEIDVDRPVPIGRPIANTTLHVLSPHGLPQPAGCIGELYIGGAGVARGYAKLERMTAERFVRDPFASSTDERLYRTGDLVRMLADGELEFVGRADGQVKIRGYRIELAEIEAMLRRQPAVQDAVVALAGDAEDKRLVAYVTLDAAAVPAAARMVALRAEPGFAGETCYRVGGGIELCGVNKAETEYLHDEIFVHKVYDKHGITVREGDTIFDVGANIGAYSIFLATRFLRLTIHSFEPIPVVHRRLEANARVFGPDKIHAHCLGLSDAEKCTQFSFYPNVSLYSGIDKGRAENIDIVRTFLVNKTADASEQASAGELETLAEDRLRTERVDVSLSTISAQIERLGIASIDLLKIDVERSELDVLNGIAPEHWPKIRQIVVEVHDVDGAIERVTAMLEGHGFAVVRDQDADLIGTELFNLYARRPAPSEPLPDMDASKWRGSHDVTLGLRRELEAALPDYMVPSAFVLIDRIPLTHNGKIDYKKLPAADAAVGRELYVAPRSAAERTLCELWAKLLKRERVGIHDDFFDLGGHSLLALRMISHVREAFGAELSIRSLFERPTVAELAAGLNCETPPSPLRIPRADRSRPLPLSWAQQRLWFFDKFGSSASTAYHVPFGLRLRGRLDVHALRAALDRIVARHEALRAMFVLRDGQPVQLFAPPDVGFALSEHDLRASAGVTREAQVAEHCRLEASAPFELTRGPLARGRLLSLADDDHVLLVTLHHIVVDGWSIGVLVKEFSALYAAFLDGRADPLPALPIQYGDYAAWQRQWLVGERLEQQLAFWREYLAGAPASLELPTDRPRPAVQSFAGATVDFTIDSELTTRLRALAKRNDVTLFMVLLSAWSLLLARLSGQNDIVVGTPVANRRSEEVEPLIGLFINTLAMRVRLDDDATVADLLAHTKASALAAFSHQDVPFEQVVEAVQPVRSLRQSPIFQVAMGLNNTPDRTELALEDVSIGQFDLPHTTSLFDMALRLNDGGDRVGGVLEYATELFDAATVRRTLAQLENLLRGMAEDEHRNASALPLLDAATRRQVLEEFNATSVPYPRDALLHELFEAEAARSPAAPALVYEGETVSYGELNARANQVAHRLQAMGAEPDARVVVCLERSVELIVAELGVLKAGAAYVPLDANNPPERLAQLLEDAEPIAVLTSASLRERFAGAKVPV